MSYIKQSSDAGKTQFNIRLPSSVVEELNQLKKEVEATGNELDTTALVADGILSGIKKVRKQLAPAKESK